jgi:3-demethoxyubiquinol 3-hydroxylase
MPKKMPKKNKKTILPGDKTATKKRKRILRVNHAGEWGAKYIYAGQLAAMRRRGALRRDLCLVEEMAAQEEEHLETFANLLVKERVRPTLLSPFWQWAGYALGYGTAMLGTKTAMACTVAVEEVIDQHYAAQYEFLQEHDPALAKIVARFRDDEIHHRDTGLAEGAEDIAYYRLLRMLIAAGSRAAIKIAERI